MPVLSKRIVLDFFYLLIFYFEKFSTDVCRLLCAVNVNLNLSTSYKHILTSSTLNFITSTYRSITTEWSLTVIHCLNCKHVDVSGFSI